jgi:hypothetical protein
MSVGTVRGGLGVAAEYMMRIVNAGLARPRPVTSLVGHVTYPGCRLPHVNRWRLQGHGRVAGGGLLRDPVGPATRRVFRGLNLIFQPVAFFDGQCFCPT